MDRMCRMMEAMVAGLLNSCWMPDSWGKNWGLNPVATRHEWLSKACEYYYYSKKARATRMLEAMVTGLWNS